MLRTRARQPAANSRGISQLESEEAIALEIWRNTFHNVQEIQLGKSEWNTVKTNTIGIVQKLHLKEFKNNSWYTFEEKGLLLKEGIALNSHHKYCKCTFKNYTILPGELNLRVELLTKEWILPCMPTPVIHWWNIFRTQIWQVYSDLFVAPKTS